MLTLSF